MLIAADRADKLSMFATYFRNPEMINVVVLHYQRVPREEVEKFAREYLLKENRASLLYVPRGTSSMEAA
jgi:hypothetical protein